jgi:hypothetical protein
MFLASETLLFFVPGIITEGGPQFVPAASFLPLRYLPNAQDPGAVPQLCHPNPIFSLQGQPRAVGNSRVVMLRFDGEQMSGLVNQEPGNALHSVFLDQRTIRLEFFTKIQLGDDPCDQDEIILDAVSLKLGVIVGP